MFKLLKEKLGSWVKKTKEKIGAGKEKPAEAPKPKPEKAVKKKVEEKAVIKELEPEESEEELEEEIEEALEESKIEEPEAEEEEEEEEKEKKPGFLARVKGAFVYKINEEDFGELFEDLEMSLLENNAALEVVEAIKSSLEKDLVGKEIKKEALEQEIKAGLRKALEDIIIEPDDILDTIKAVKGQGPFVVLFFGINGAGKTTSVAKFSHLLKKNNLSSVLAAADTFRAASIEQLQVHADRLGTKMIKHDYGSDPSAVAYDAIEYAKAHNIDVVLIDTAGRMHTKEDLLREMEKIVRVTNPDLKVFVAEAIAGNDATEQAKAFNEAIEIDGAILSKTDVDEKGGTVISISHATKKPILYIGTGQEYDDLELFDKEAFIEKLGL